MHLSIVIPAYNEAEYLKRTVSKIKYALQNNTENRFSWEIIICDNNSLDNTAQVANELGAKVVFEPLNQISRARNKGAL